MSNPITISNASTNGVFLMFEEITEQTARSFAEFILHHNLHPQGKKNLTLVVNSPGGNLYSGFAIIDLIRSSKIPVYTVGMGMVASAGLLIFMNGKPKHRVLTPNTSLLSHQYASGAFGKEHELLAVGKYFELTSENILRVYKECTKLPEKKIREVLLPPTDVWMSAEEAMKYNICDEVRDFKYE